MSAALDLIAQKIATFLAPIINGLQNPITMQRLLDEIGVLDDDQPTLVTALSAATELASELQSLASQPALSFDSFRAVLEASRSAHALISALSDQRSPVDAVQGLGADLVSLLTTAWLNQQSPVARDIAVLLTLIKPAADQDFQITTSAAGDLVRAAFRIDRFQLGRLADLLGAPEATLRTDYVNPLTTDAEAAAVASKLFPRLQAILRDLGVSCRFGIDPLDAPRLENSAGLMANSLIIYADDALSCATEAGLVLSISAASQGDLGLVITPFGALQLTQQLANWTIETQATAGLGALAYGRNGLTLSPSAASGELSVKATSIPVDSGPAHVFGQPGGTRLEIGQVVASVDAQLSAAQQSLELAFTMSQSAIAIAAGDSDGFIGSILPAGGMRTEFDLGLNWSSDKGLTLSGQAGLAATLPVGLSVAGVTLSGVYLSVLADNGQINAEVSAGLVASIGPVQASIERVGLAASLSFPQSGGNLGVADIALGLKPPSGVGLAIDAEGVLTGGGFLSFDAASGTYSGAMQLSLHDQLTLNGYGLIAAKMPDGSSGFSMLVFITADGFEPVQLGFGFMLRSVGGMLGINRSFDADVIEAALKADTLKTLLLPQDPVGNAPTLLASLSKAFPAQQGSYLLGLLAHITWFEPTLVDIDLALVLQLGTRNRLLALGRVSALLPSADNDLIRLILDADGVLDFDEGTFSADAVLVDSRLVHQFPITGQAALRGRWSGAGDTGPSFVLAVGGLNPHFTPPDGFPQLERVSIALCSGGNPRLICDAYLAVTANTVQFGAQVSLYAAALGFSVTGDLGFDALVTLVPPHFLIDFHASVQLKRGSHNLFKVSLDGTLEGPIPLRLSTKATFEILWISFSVHFNFTLADGDASQPQIPSVPLADELTATLADPTSWHTQMIPGQTHGVTLRNLPAADAFVLDPLGQLVVQQQLVPLNTVQPIDTFGGAPIAGAQRFQVGATLSGRGGAPVTGAFAPARYFTLSDDDKLTAPSFEMMTAGFVLGNATPVFDPAATVPAPLSYQTVVFDVPQASAAANTAVAASAMKPSTAAATAKPAPVAATVKPAAAAPPPLYTMPLVALQAQRNTGSAARAPVRQVGRARFRNTAAPAAATLRQIGWTIVNAASGAPAPPNPRLTSWSEYRAALATLNRGGAQWLMVPNHELKTA
jgi:hypothetical protein